MYSQLLDSLSFPSSWGSTNYNSVCSLLSFIYLLRQVKRIRKSSKLNWEGYLLKNVLLLIVGTGALKHKLSPRDKTSSIVFVIHSDLRLIHERTYVFPSIPR